MSGSTPPSARVGPSATGSSASATVVSTRPDSADRRPVSTPRPRKNR